MQNTALHPTWSEADWPSDVVPVPLGPGYRPLDPTRLRLFPGSRSHFYFIAPALSAVRPDAAAIAHSAILERPDVGLFYADDAVVAKDGSIASVHCKPIFNFALLLADDYVGFPLLVRADCFDVVALEPTDHGARWYRLCLDLLTAGIPIDRITETLLASADTRPKAAPGDRAAAASAWLAKTGQPYTLRAGRAAGTSRLERHFAAFPSLTLVVPTRQSAPLDQDGQAGAPFIATLLNSLGRSTYPQDKITVLVGDDADDDAIFRGRCDRFALRRIATRPSDGQRFNYAAKMNRLWRAAETDHLILMNDDIGILSRDWIEALLTFSMNQEMDGVGTRLLFPDGRLQHAGMFGGIFGVCAHPWYLQSEEEPSYEGWAETQRDCSAVTGAVFATRRGPMEAVNGFDEGFSLDFNDVDICFKMRMLGYRIVYTPFAEMTHYERASRRDNLAPGSQVARYLRRWADVLANDPQFSPQLRDDTDRIAPRDAASAWIRKRPDLFGSAPS